MKSFLNELHKNKKIKVRLSIALLFLLIDFSSFGYLAYVIITEYFRYLSRRGMPFLNSFYFKLITIIGISLFAGILTGESEVFAYIIAYIIIASIIELPIKFIITIRSLFKQRKRMEEDDVEYENVREIKFTHSSRKTRVKNAQYREIRDYEDITDIPGAKKFEETPPKQQYKISQCPSCGYRNKILYGEIAECEYCGTAID